MQPLNPGTRLASSRGEVVVEKLLGAGGQGAVYAARVGAETVALKWYHNQVTQTPELAAQRVAIEQMIGETPPSPLFLWPLALVTQPKTRAFGYLMALRGDGFVDATKLVNGHARFEGQGGPYRLTTLMALRIVEAFRRLHAAGFVYKDLNLGGPFVDPSTGQVRICDCDNVRPNNTPGTVFFPEFAAPEVVLGSQFPTVLTDRHSVAVLLFYLFVRGNPFDGRHGASINIFTDAAKRQLYGEKPVFVFHAKNQSNAPVRGVHDAMLQNWPRIPLRLQELFARTFERGVSHPGDRPLLDEWIEVLRISYDTLVRCQNAACKGEYFGPDTQGGGGVGTCTWCGHVHDTARVGKIRFANSREVYLTPHLRLLEDHIGERRDFDTEVGAMVASLTVPERIGLQNLSKYPWTAAPPTGGEVVVEPGKSLVLLRGMTIQFRSRSKVVEGKVL